MPVYDDTSDRDAPSCDWPDASYSAQAEPNGVSGWTVTHELVGTPGVEALLASGAARYAVEARCAHSLYLSSETSAEAATIIAVDVALTGWALIYLWPGVVTVEDCQLDTAGSAWGASFVPVAKGRWLARGAPLDVESGFAAPLVFRPAKDIKPKGRVAIAAEAAGGDTRFVVKARPGRIARLHDDPVALMACWATALAMIAHDSNYKITEESAGPIVEGSQMGDSLVRRLHAEGIPLWNDDAWDPMLAASAFVPLQASPNEEE